MTRPLRNLGPRSLEMLTKAGIEDEARLRALGSVAAYLAVKRVWSGASLNLLWALEGAVSGRHWREVAQQDRLALLLQLESLQGPLGGKTRRRTRRRKP